MVKKHSKNTAKMWYKYGINMVKICGINKYGKNMVKIQQKCVKIQ